MSIDELREKYANHEYMKQKLENYITNLPVLMKTIEEDYRKKEEKKQQLVKMREEFINNFTKFRLFYYIPQTDIYVEKELNIISEDYISHLISANIEKQLISSKYKITHSIFKKIKETTIFQAQINSYMLEKIVQMMPFSKQSIYFLTIIGDILLNKEPLIYFIDASYKHYLKTLNQSIYFVLNKSILDGFKHKYYDHKYTSCRIITGTCPEYETTDPIRTIVASIHYSNLYGNSDGFLKSNDCSFSVNALLLSNHTPDTLVQQFLSTSMVKEEGQTMSYKDVYFLWKLFLKKNSLPFVLSQQNFKSSISYLCEGDMCMNLTTTMQMPFLKIKQFWEKYIVYDEDSYYELQELVDLYQKQEKTTITIDSMKEILQIEYPHIYIDDTIVLNIKCLLWNKSIDIDNAMEVFKHHESYSTNIDDMYLFYLEYTKKNHKRKVSKEYFEKFFN